MKLLVLGGTHHVGRAVVETALARGDDVTTLNRGLTGHQPQGARALQADRTDSTSLRAALGDESWDAVIDTWSGAPAVVGDAAALLAGRAGHYGYVSSVSVYADPVPRGSDESAPTVAADPASTDGTDYQAAKRGGELAAAAAFGDRALLARAGLILGPYEIVGRMPWWLRRMERGGDVLAPGPQDLPLQYIDGRDLAAWLLSAAERGVGGAFNTVSRRGHATMASLLEAAREVTGSRATLVWVPPEVIEQAGIGDDEARADVFHGNTALHEQRRIGFENPFELAEGFGKDQSFDHAGAILQRQDRPARAAARTHRTNLHDDSGDHQVLVVLAALHRGQLGCV